MTNEHKCRIGTDLFDLAFDTPYEAPRANDRKEPETMPIRGPPKMCIHTTTYSLCSMLLHCFSATELATLAKSFMNCVRPGPEVFHQAAPPDLGRSVCRWWRRGPWFAGRRRMGLRAVSALGISVGDELSRWYQFALASIQDCSLNTV